MEQSGPGTDLPRCQEAKWPIAVIIPNNTITQRPRGFYLRQVPFGSADPWKNHSLNGISASNKVLYFAKVMFECGNVLYRRGYKIKCRTIG